MSEKRRFGDTTDDEIMRKRQATAAKNTLRSNHSAAEMLRQYLKEKQQPQNFEDFDENKLAEVLTHFYLDARTKSGDLYKAKSFENIRYSLNRYLKSPPFLKKFDILTHDAFIDSNECFKAALVEIKKAGKGSIQHYPKILESDLRKLYKSIFLDPSTPNGLLNRVQMNIRLFFCRRANENMCQMSKDTFVVSSYDDGTKYVMKKDDELTKNHRSNDNELVTGHMPEDRNNPSFCPVATFSKYISKLNPNCDRLWQYPRDSFDETDITWYQNRPIGRDTMAKFMQSLSKKVQLSQIYTNHCIRVTGTSLLSQNNFSSAQIMSITGHKSVNSLSIYQRVTDKEKHAMGVAICESIQPQSALKNALPAPPEMKGLPEPYSYRNLQAPIKEGQLTSNASMTVPSTSNLVELDGVNLDDIFSDFELDNSPSCHTVSTSVVTSLQNYRTPVFQGCTISNLNINININKTQ